MRDQPMLIARGVNLRWTDGIVFGGAMFVLASAKEIWSKNQLYCPH